MNKQQAIAKFNEEFQAKLRETKFPDEALHKDFDRWKHAAFNFESPLSMEKSYGVMWEAYKVMLVKTHGFTLFEIAMIANVIEARTPNELDRMVEENYYVIQQYVQDLNKKWKEITKPFTEELERKIKIMADTPGRNGKVINGGSKFHQ